DVAHAVVQFAAHVGHQVHDVGIALDGHGVRDLDRAGLGNAADVVAGQVDEHDVFGALLRVGQQLLFQAQIFFLGGAALARAGQGADGDGFAGAAVLEFAVLAHQDFRRGAHDVERVEVPVVHVGR